MSRPIRWIGRGATLASIGVVGGALAVTTRYLLATPQPLESRLFGESQIDRRDEGDILYAVAGPAAAEPVVLLHDFYPGASGDEFRRLYPRLAPDYRVYAPDWLGFGLSERPALAYTGEFYASLLTGFLRDTVRRPVTVIASGLAGNIAVRAASDTPDLFARLVLIEPRPLADTLPGPTLTQSLVRALQRSSLGLIPYALLATRPALRWQLRRHAAYAGEGAATDDVLDHVYASAHQFGGHHALLAVLTGELDLPIEHLLPSLEPPVLIVGGGGDGSRSLAALQDMALLHPQARLLTIPDAGPAVHEDQPAALMEHLVAWLRVPGERTSARITETRASARTFAGATRVGRAVEEAGPDADGSATAATPIAAAPAVQTDEPRDAAPAAPSPEGPADRTVYTDEFADAYDLIPEARPLPAEDDPPRQMSSPISELEAADAGADSAATQPDLTAVRSQQPPVPGVTMLTSQPFEATTPDPSAESRAAQASTMPGMPEEVSESSGDVERSEPGSASQAASPGSSRRRRAGSAATDRSSADSAAGEREGASGARKRGGASAAREWPMPGGHNKHGSRRHKHSSH